MDDLVYAGDKTPLETWDILSHESGSILLDVRTSAEWSYVGIPDLTDIGKEVFLIPWQEFPAMEVNLHFVEQVRSVAPSPDAPLLMLCRSGVRSRSAAAAMTATGYSACFNVLEGFEGDKDSSQHRGTLGGWKHHGLPWKQS